MTIPSPPSTEHQFQGYERRAADRGRRFRNQSIDLATSGSATSITYDAVGMDKCSVRAQAAAWESAEASLQGSVDGSNWTTIAALNTSTPQQIAQDIQAYPYVRVAVTTDDGDASPAVVSLYIYKTV